MLANITGIYEGFSSHMNGDKAVTSIILNQLGQEDKVKIKVTEGFKFPKNGDEVIVTVEIKKGSYQGKPYVSMKALN